MSMDTDPPAGSSSGRLLQVHRCRVVNYSPAGIVSLAVTPEATKSEPHAGKRRVVLACARSNGDVELWNPRGQGWFLERTIPGSPNSSVETVLWIHRTAVDPETTKDSDFDSQEERAAYIRALRAAPPRLITAGLDGRIVEWDTISLRPRQIAEPGGGAVWCVAVNQSHTRLAVGCEDGHVRILDVADGRLEFIKLLEKAPTRILSIAWHPVGQYVVVGGADSSIRKVDVRTGQIVQRLTTDTVPGEETIVWDLKVLQDSTIVSGDSMGKVTFWDWKSGTPVRSVKAHGADVLCLVANKAGTKVWSSGVDRKVVQISLIDLGSTASVTKSPAREGKKKVSKHSKQGGSKNWVVSGEKRYHSHDVRALSLLEGRPYDALVSGGVDSTLVVSSPLTEFPYLKQYRMPTFPHRPIIQITRRSRFLLARFPDHVKLWQLGRALPMQRPPSSLDNYERLEHQPEKLILNIKPKCATNLTSSAISENGEWIAVSDMESVKLFRVQASGHNGLPRVRRAKTFPSSTEGPIPGAHALCFTPDSMRLIIGGSDSVVYVVDLSQSRDDIFGIVKTFEVHRGDEAGEVEVPADGDAMDVDGVGIPTNSAGKLVTGGEREMVATLAVSGDGQWLASGDLLNRIHVFNLDSLKHHATLPIFSSLHTSLTFHPSSPTLVVTCTSNEFFLYDCEEATLTDWSREYSHRLPYRWLQRKEVVMGVGFDPKRPAVVTLWGATHLCFVDLEKPMGPRDAVISVRRRKLLQYRAKKLHGGSQKIPKAADEGSPVVDKSMVDDELAELERREYEKRRKAAAREIAKAANGLTNGVGKKNQNKNTTSSDDEEEEESQHMVENGVILIDSGSEHDESGDLEDEGDGIPIVNGIDHENDTHAAARAGTKRQHSDSNGKVTGPTKLAANTFSESFQMEHRYSPLMGLGYVGDDELVVVERPILSVLQSLGVGGYYKHKYGT
ncbi:hypothetical protein SpCBS45565_g04902 [Spizellomyces sp. 'palustris']|nr:hypothetical protein SpCBS45565_g04902 [Spizellomyces sp. 'palustris']